MKTASSAALKFSGNHLRIIEDNVPYGQLDSHLKVVRDDKNKSMSSGISNQQVNDPGNWDIAWFAHYE